MRLEITTLSVVPPGQLTGSSPSRLAAVATARCYRAAFRSALLSRWFEEAGRL